MESEVPLRRKEERNPIQKVLPRLASGKKRSIKMSLTVTVIKLLKSYFLKVQFNIHPSVILLANQILSPGCLRLLDQIVNTTRVLLVEMDSSFMERWLLDESKSRHKMSIFRTGI
ncbi:hypothetical protein CEXT_43961 [Caerostris extrusa]|uniref:Uncharacterized protein n=1 Tax=Caerostris extrusa TaxID=172846 RepID=A0AAV4NBN9_CAEEX|nr:hypothetical protein CEXT_43961 [Caerostris extrusa]